MKRILVTRRLPPLTQARLESLPVKLTQWNHYDTKIPIESFHRQSIDQDGLLIMPTERIDASVIENTRAKYISSMSTGLDHVDLDGCDRRGITVFDTPDFLTDVAAIFAMTLVMTTIRRLALANDFEMNGPWGNWDAQYMCGKQLKGKTVGIVGLGKLGFGIAERLEHVEVGKVLFNDLKPRQTRLAEFVFFDDLVSKSDVVIIACPLNEQTRNLFDKYIFGLMKPSSILINIAKGPIVNQNDLVEALDTGLIAAVGLDVANPEPLLDPLVTRLKEKVVVFPHIWSATLQTRETMASLALDQLVQALEIK